MRCGALVNRCPIPKTLSVFIVLPADRYSYVAFAIAVPAPLAAMLAAAARSNCAPKATGLQQGQAHHDEKNRSRASVPVLLLLVGITILCLVVRH